MRVASRVLDNRQPMLDTNEVGEPAHSASGAEEVTELRRTVDGGGIENDVVMYQAYTFLLCCLIWQKCMLYYNCFFIIL